MKRKIFISLIISFITVLAYNVHVRAETDITKVTTNSYEDSFPCVKGDYLVWQANEGGDWEIKLYDIETKKTLTITENDYNDILPQTDGEYVVWFGACNQGGEVFQYNIATGQTTKITNDTNVDSPPQIASGRVVWASQVVGDSVVEPGEINLFEIGGSSVQITTNSLDDISPKINSKAVVWLQIDDNDNSALFRYLLPDGPAEPAPEDFIWKDSPQTDGDLTVSIMRNGESNLEIIVRKDGENGFDQITDNTFNDRYPRISGDNIAWMSGEGKDSEIYLATYAAAGCCYGDFNSDNDVDGSDLAKFAQVGGNLSEFAQKFGMMNYGGESE